ncbi:hypothetical protein MRX96_046262 [Rhipicephalus microplus]
MRDGCLPDIFRPLERESHRRQSATKEREVGVTTSVRAAQNDEQPLQARLLSGGGVRPALYRTCGNPGIEAYTKHRHSLARVRSNVVSGSPPAVPTQRSIPWSLVLPWRRCVFRTARE